jgi:nucleoredoxin
MHALFAPALLLACLAAPRGAHAQATSPETLALNDLARRPERWPTAVKLKRDFTFGGGAAARTGQAVHVLEFDGRQVVVDAGGGLYFQIAADDCDLHEAANLAWAALTPAQRAIEPATLLADASLWPERATCRAGFTLDSGATLEPGGEYECLAVEPDGVKLYSREHNSSLYADLGQTDVIARARERVLLEPARRPSRIAAALAGTLVDARGEPWKASIADAKVFLLYYGASWCGPCRQFSPSLVEFAKASATSHPELAIVLMSNDEKDADMRAYMQDEEMPWPGVPLAKVRASPVLIGYAAGSIPHLVAVDRHGKVLASAVKNGRYVGPKQALADLERVLASGAK